MSEAKIYVGNLSYGSTDGDIESYFQQFGSIKDVKVITDRDTGRSKGFAFVTFEDPKSAKEAVEGADGKDLNGRNLKVSIAREQQGRTGGGGRGGDRGDSRERSY